MAKRTFEENLQWVVDKATATGLCDQSPSYQRILWHKDHRVVVVDKDTGEIVWMNDRERQRREKV